MLPNANQMNRKQRGPGVAKYEQFQKREDLLHLAPFGRELFREASSADETTRGVLHADT
jgi:hypothetical protein